MESQDVSFLTQFLCNYAYMWEGIGTELNFQHGELQNIKQSSPIASPQQHLNQLLDTWAQWPNSSLPTVKRLCDALRSNLVGLGVEANKLHERRYCLPSQLHKVSISVCKIAVSITTQLQTSQNVRSGGLLHHQHQS